MVAGDIDDTLAPEGRLAKLRAQFKAFDDYLKDAWHFRPIRTFFIPYGAGMNEDGTRVYISNDIQTVIDGVDCAECLVRHETTEWAARTFLGIGLDYSTDSRGHHLGNRAEHDRVIELLGPEGWDLYSRIIDPQVILDERQNVIEMEKPIPRDLAMYPYDEDEITELKVAMQNDRSVEEWEKLNEAETNR